MIKSFLMAGQSNMAGRGFLKDVEMIFDENIKALVNGRWQNMHEPINLDRPTSGAGLAAAFAAAWRLENADKQIGLIPCAEGGSSIDEWAVDGILFENAVIHAKLAQRSSRLSGILWHQGENDSFGGRWTAYFEKLSAVVAAFRRDLDAPEIPFIVGGLGDHLASGRYAQYFTEYGKVNEELLRFAKETPNCYFVTAEGLTANPDGLHFDATSLRIFGLRYLGAYELRTHILEPMPSERNIALSLPDRKLNKSEKAFLLEMQFGRGELTLPELETQLAAVKEGN